MLNELTQYMKDCNLEYKDFKPIDFELLASFIETIFKDKLKEVVRAKFKRHGALGNMKYGSVYIVRGRGITKNLILFQKDGTVEIPNEVTDNEKNAVKTSFTKWCDILQFEKYKEA